MGSRPAIWCRLGRVSPEFRDTRYDVIPDLARVPELRWLNNHDGVGSWALGVASYLIAGWSGLVVGFFASTVLLWHATFAINSLAHLVGGRRYDTADTSRNSWALALITFGEGWHNNHHRCHLGPPRLPMVGDRHHLPAAARLAPHRPRTPPPPTQPRRAQPHPDPRAPPASRPRNALMLTATTRPVPAAETDARR